MLLKKGVGTSDIACIGRAEHWDSEREVQWVQVRLEALRGFGASEILPSLSLSLRPRSCGPCRTGPRPWSTSAHALT